MKNIKLLLLLLLLGAAFKAQSQAYVKGTSVISLGIGLGSHFTGYTVDSRSPTLSFQYEKGLWAVGPGVISLGGYAGFTTYSYYTPTNKEKANYTIIGARGAYHFNGWRSDNEHLKKLDVYAGAMISYSFTSGNDFYNYGSYSNVSPYAGGRYFFTNNFGAFAEIGYGVSYLTLGGCLKF